MRFVAGTVAKTVIVVATLAVLFAVYMFGYRLPKENAQKEWIACAKPHIEKAEYWLHQGDLAKSEAEQKLTNACGDAPE